MRRLFSLLLTLFVFAALPLGAYAALAYEPARPARDLGHGITYSVEPIRASSHGSGRIYLARVKLDPDRIDLFVTPMAPGADDKTWTHRLEHTAVAAAKYDLPVAINLCIFSGGSWPIRRVGQRARTAETTVVDGQVVSLWEHTYILGFHPDLTPEPIESKPPPVSRLSSWKWAVGGQSWPLYRGEYSPYTGGGLPDFRTAVAVNVENRELYLAAFDHADFAAVAEELIVRGAVYGFTVDSGDSTSMVIEGKTVVGGWRPVANHFGVRSRKR